MQKVESYATTLCSTETLSKGKITIRQYNFPVFFYQNQDEIMTDYHNKIRSMDRETFFSVLKEYGVEFYKLEEDILKMDGQNFFSFCCKILKQDTGGWTGCRILCEVVSGFKHFIFQVFYKHPKSLDIELYTGN